VCEVYEIHDAEHKREAGGHKKQHYAKLQAVEELLEE
jgi:hypothetical protein